MGVNKCNSSTSTPPAAGGERSDAPGLNHQYFIGFDYRG